MYAVQSPECWNKISLMITTLPVLKTCQTTMTYCKKDVNMIRRHIAGEERREEGISNHELHKFGVGSELSEV